MASNSKKSGGRKRTLSKTPRAHNHSRKVHFGLAMREKISKNWVELRKDLRKEMQKGMRKKKS